MPDHTLRDEFEKQYLRSFDTRQEIVSSFALPVSVIGILGGFLVFLLSGLSRDHLVLNIVLTIIALVLFICLVASSIYLARAYHKHAYWHVPTGNELRLWHRELTHYYEAKKVEAPENIAEKEIIDYLSDRFAENAHLNFLTNQKRLELFHQANKHLVRAMGIAIVGAIVAAGVRYGASSECKADSGGFVRKGKLSEVQDGRITMSDDSQKTPPKSPPPPPDKPKPPPDRLIYDGWKPSDTTKK